ncbi:hypothetical protein [Polynucleobacter tropicus]|nr:hypothetical protein [Polynucleobacter tropicus]
MDIPINRQAMGRWNLFTSRVVAKAFLFTPSLSNNVVDQIKNYVVAQ